MEKKEFYRQYLPHFQLPGQAYFVTWSLKDAIPPKAFISYTQKMQSLQDEIIKLKNLKVEDTVIENLKKEFNLVRRKYIKAYNDLLDLELHPYINLSKPENTKAIADSLKFWEGKKLENCAFCIMSNHIHWVFTTLEKDKEGNPVYVQDIMKSVKQFSSNCINKIENRMGTLWQKENFDTTIRNQEHMYNVINYTLNNPVKAGLTSDWRLWPGNYCAEEFK